MRTRFIVRRIDRALKRLYNLNTPFRAEQFLLATPPTANVRAGNAALRGAVYLHEEAPTDLSVGIYLSQEVGEQLESFARWPATWTTSQLDAFTVAAEEVSHFHLILFHALQGRQLSHLGLEMQGEIDKFLLTYFSHGSEAVHFQPLFERLFEKFYLADSLNEEQKTRYLEANQLAKRFLMKHARMLQDPARREWGFRLLRRFYRLNSSEKISLISA